MPIKHGILNFHFFYKYLKLTKNQFDDKFFSLHSLNYGQFRK